jgi:hypothetical protein
MKLQGVLAAAVFGRDDACLEFSATEPLFEPIMFLAAMQAAEESLQVFRTLDKLSDASALTCELEHGYFVFRQTAHLRLGVMVATGANIAMLDVAVGVAVLKLAQAEQRGGGAAPGGPASGEYSVPYAAAAIGTRPSAQRSAPAMPAPGMASGPVPPAPLPAVRHPATVPPPFRGRNSEPPPLAPGSHSGVTGQPYEQWTAEELLPNGARIPGTIGPVAMQHVLRSLARFLGGHAKSVIVEELAHLGATPATARPDVFTDLIHNVAARIPDPGMHDEFVKIALGDRR